MTDPIHGIGHVIPPYLAKAYREALYFIHGEDGDIQLRVDQTSLGLALLMKDHGVRSAAFLTAFNPYSILEVAEVNLSNHNALIADVHALGLRSISGDGGDPLHLWPSEPSILVLGISHQNAELLAGRYGQNAYLWIEGDDGLVNLNLRYSVRGLLQ